MTKGTLLKFLFVSLSNMKRLVFINLIFLIPILVFLYTLIQLVPLVIRCLDSMNVSVLYVNPEYKKLAVVIISKKTGAEGRINDVYIFDRKAFNPVRKHIFLSELDENSLNILRENALVFGEIYYPNQQVSLESKTGEKIITFRVENVREGSIEVLFYNFVTPTDKGLVVIYSTLMVLSFLLISGSLGGIIDYTQRVVFHETKGFSYLFKSIKKNFARSVIITLFFSIITGAVVSNIYFYIFIMSADISVFIAAINFWMLIFFIFILLWVFPLFVMSKGESVWKIMKKSLFVSFDNFDFTIDALFFLFLMGILSIVTLFIIPGFAGTFSFLNTALKEVSSRYNKSDVAT